MNKIYLDMDGVLADFVTGVEGPDYINGPLQDENHYDNKKAEYINKRLFRNLPVMPGMLDLCQRYRFALGGPYSNRRDQ